jgi:tRNA nucleotidyltransferase (CCA-adding enzyme)
VGDPNWRFQEDYLRILRALRFSARFEFRIHGATREAAQANAQGLAQLSAERVRDEWFKGIMTARRVSRLVTLWREIGAARIWLPEIAAQVEARGAQVVDALPRDPILVTAFLATDPASLLTRLKCANRDIERGRAMREWRDCYPDPKRVTDVRRWLSQTGPAADDLLTQLAATAPRTALPRVVEAIRAARDPLTLKDLSVHGEDLITAGVRPGPDVGEMLQRLLADVLEDPRRNTRDHLLARVREWLKAA